MDSPVGYTYGRLGTMFAGSPTPTSPPPAGGRIPVQAAYANGSRERVVEPPAFQQAHGHSTSVSGVTRAGAAVVMNSNAPGRVSPGFASGAPGRVSPGFSGGGLGVTGLVRPPGLDSHIELDERSMRTESGYGFGGIAVNGDGVMLSPVDDTDEPYSPTDVLRELGEGGEERDEEEGEVQRLLQPGVFEGEYESTEGHAAPRSAESGGMSQYHVPFETRPTPHVHTFGEEQTLGDGDMDSTVQGHVAVNFPKPVPQLSPVEAQPSSYPYPTTYPGQDESPDTSGEVSNSTLDQPKLPPGLEHLIQRVEAENAMDRQPSRDSTVERDLLGELARQLQRVVDQQSTSTLAQPHTPSSMLFLENTGSSSRTDSEATDKLDEFGSWNVGDLKGAVERMKALIDEQEQKMQSSRGHTRAKNSISLNDTPPPMRNASLPSEVNSAQHVPSFGENGQTTPRRRLSNAVLAVEGDKSGARRKESQGSSSATAASTTVVTPITPHDGPSFPLPSFKSGSSHDRVESFDFASLDPDLVAMLSPNHMIGGQVEATVSGT
jgi:hypothetical protein